MKMNNHLTKLCLAALTSFLKEVCGTEAEPQDLAQD